MIPYSKDDYDQQINDLAMSNLAAYLRKCKYIESLQKGPFLMPVTDEEVVWFEEFFKDFEDDQCICCRF